MNRSDWRSHATITIVLAMLFALLPSTARADWHLTPFLGLTFKGDTTLFDWENAAGNRHWHFGGAVGVIGEGPIGVEGLIVWTPGFFQREDAPPPDVVSSRTLVIMGNVVLTTPRRWNEYGLRPFVSGGLGLIHASAMDSPELSPVDANLWGYNVGGGAVGFLSDRTGLRFDLRYFSTLKETETTQSATGVANLSYWTASVGVVFRY